MMRARAMKSNWRGHLKLQLISCPIALYPASTRKERIAFNKISKETNTKLKQQYIDPTTNKVCESWEQTRGYPISKTDFIVITDEELDNLKLESTKIIEISQFIQEDEVDSRYLETPYFIAPTDQVGQDAFAIIRDGMKEKKVCAIATVVISRRERTIMLKPYGKGILGTLLRFPYEVREADAYFTDIPNITLDPEIKELAGKIFDRNTKPFIIGYMEDRYENAIVELIRNKQNGHMPKPQEVEVPQKVPHSVNIKDLLLLMQAESPKKPKRKRKAA